MAAKEGGGIDYHSALQGRPGSRDRFVFSLVAFGNITDYDSNWQLVQHTLSMDTTFPDSALHWRAITNSVLQKTGYWIIIATELMIAITLWVASFRLLANLGSRDFARSKGIATAGLTLGVLLYMVGFITVGGEWFTMWQSHTWNGEPKAFNFIMMISAVLIFLNLAEDGYLK